MGLALPSGIPSDDTFRRVFSRLDTDAFAACFGGFVETLREVTVGEGIALEGKTLRHTAVNLLRKPSGKMGVKAKQKKAGWDETFLMEVILA